MSYIIMGVSGSGKSTIGKLLAERLQLEFIDADDHHPPTNISKMSSGIALSDDDRKQWLKGLNKLLKQAENNKEIVLACSALREEYRQLLQQGISKEMKWVFLHGPEEILRSRIAARKNHFMPEALLASQLQALEQPEYGLHITISVAPQTIINKIVNHFMADTKTAAFGIIGMGVMGKSLALNLSGKGVKTAVFNRHLAGFEENVAKQFTEENPENSLLPFDDLQQFIESLERPRKILLMIKAGKAVDIIVEQLLPLLDENDVIMDGGNSLFHDTRRRTNALANKKIHFLGVGISGGEEGALKGPSLMPGGTKQGYKIVAGYLLKIAARDKNGEPCCAFIGPEGAGHFVKMVHNGIEYAEMQALAEVYQLMRFHLQLPPEKIVEELEQWQQSGLGSFLLEVTIAILKKYENNTLLLDKILDAAEQKGTGGWSTTAALDLGVSLDPIAASVMARYLSAQKEQRVQAAEFYQIKAEKLPKQERPHQLKKAYNAVRIINHATGFELIKQASIEYNWQLSLSTIARIWTNGCIIRSELMEQLAEVFKSEQNMLLHPSMKNVISEALPAWKKVVSKGIKANAALPVFSAALNYFLGFTTAQSPANLIQAQRDFFGAHTFRRTDKPADQYFHAEW